VVGCELVCSKIIGELHDFFFRGRLSISSKPVLNGSTGSRGDDHNDW